MSFSTTPSFFATPLIQHYESCSLPPYLDPSDIPTIGWGNTTYQDGTRVTMDDQPLTQDQADILFQYFLQSFTLEVIKLCGGVGEGYQLGAFISLAYNIGDGNFERSSALRFFRTKSYARVGPAIELWNRSGNQILKGLQRRRRAESLVFNGMAIADALVEGEKAYP